MSKRDDICDAALELFAEKGIEATTTREITERAGAAEGTLYRHFEGKADLAEWLYQRCVNDVRERLLEAAEPASDPTDRLEALVRGVFDFFAAQPTSCTYLLSARRSTGANGTTAPPPPMELFVEVLEAGMDRGTFREASAPLAAGWVLAMVQRTVLLLKTGTLELGEQDAIEQTVDAVLQLVKPNTN